MNKQQTILITGVAGLLGSRLAEHILDNKPGFRVVGIDDMSGGYESNIPDGVTFYKSNITDGKLAEIFANEKPDYVFHFAAYAAEGLSPFVRSFNYTNNLTATSIIGDNSLFRLFINFPICL